MLQHDGIQKSDEKSNGIIQELRPSRSLSSYQIKSFAVQADSDIRSPSKRFARLSSLLSHENTYPSAMKVCIRRAIDIFDFL